MNLLFWYSSNLNVGGVKINILFINILILKMKRKAFEILIWSNLDVKTANNILYLGCFKTY